MAEKEQLIEAIQSITGRLPEGTNDILRAIVHPSVIKKTKAYVESLDPESQCLNYQAPWSCFRETEARWENAQYGWLGGINDMTVDAAWCKNCRAKVMENEIPVSRPEEELADAIHRIHSLIEENDCG